MAGTADPPSANDNPLQVVVTIGFLLLARHIQTWQGRQAADGACLRTGVRLLDEKYHEKSPPFGELYS
jgi:hypothetical protein